MNKEELVKRIADIQAAVDQNTTQHQQVSANLNALHGRLAEAKYMLEFLEKAAEEVMNVVQLVDG